MVQELAESQAMNGSTGQLNLGNFAIILFERSHSHLNQKFKKTQSHSKKYWKYVRQNIVKKSNRNC